MKKILFNLTLIALFLIYPSALSAQEDCDVVVQPRFVPESNSFVYATRYYTMQTYTGAVTFNALTADGAVAVVFIAGDGRESCIDERSSIHIKFRNGEDIAMVNGGGANCENRFALYFSEELGNMRLLDMFRNNKIRFVKIWMKDGKWLRVDFVDGMAYNLMKSMNCLSEKIGVPNLTPSDVLGMMEKSDALVMLEKKDSIDSTSVYVRPQFKGSDLDMRAFFGRHMRTRSAVDRGVVHVRFKVDAEGNIHDPRVTRGVSEKVDDEARRLVSIMPRVATSHKEWYSGGSVYECCNRVLAKLLAV